MPCRYASARVTSGYVRHASRSCALPPFLRPTTASARRACIRHSPATAVVMARRSVPFRGPSLPTRARPAPHARKNFEVFTSALWATPTRCFEPSRSGLLPAPQSGTYGRSRQRVVPAHSGIRRGGRIAPQAYRAAIGAPTTTMETDRSADPRASGSGIGSGKPGVRNGSQQCSLSMWAA